jgi:hypothetical protein
VVDESHGGPEIAGGTRRRIAAGAGADDDEVEMLFSNDGFSALPRWSN